MLTHSGIICHAVMVGWVSPLVCIADAMAIELSLHVYSLFIYFVFGICHPEKGSAMNLMNPKDLCTVGELLAQDCSRRAGRS